MLFHSPQDVVYHRTCNLWQHLKTCKKRNDLFGEHGADLKLVAELETHNVKRPDTNQASLTLGSGGLKLVEKFNNVKLEDFITRLQVEEDIPASKLEGPAFNDLVRYLQALAKPPSRRTQSRNTSEAYAKISDDLKGQLAKDTVLVHTMQDSWTDKGMRETYVGHLVTWVNEKFEFEERLLKFAPLKGGHDAVALAQEIKTVWEKFELLDRIGSCTADNASTNVSAYEKLAREFEIELVPEEPAPSMMIPCINHVMNLAVGNFLVGASLLEPKNYTEFVRNNMFPPEILITAPEAESERNSQEGGDEADRENSDGESGQEKGIDDEENEDEDERGNPESPVPLGGGVVNIAAELARAKEAKKVAAAKKKEEKIEFEERSPVGKVRRASKHVLASPARRKVWAQACENAKIKNLLPILDVRTRWNSLYDMLVRYLRNRQAPKYYAFAMRNSPKPPPEISSEENIHIQRVCDVLEQFKTFTAVFSAVDARLDLVLVSYDFMIEKLETMKQELAPLPWTNALEVTITKLRKYYVRCLDNDWVCAALALNPNYGFTKLEKIFDKNRVLPSGSDGESEDVVIVEPDTTRSDGVYSIFASYEQEPAQTQREDELARYQREERSLTQKHVPILVIWNNLQKSMPGLAWAARCIYGASATSTSVERLFSAARSTLDGRERLTPRHLAQALTLKISYKRARLDQNKEQARTGKNGNENVQKGQAKKK
ncbi:hypothetical protein JCM16303_004102 [Sporobolomyces ruberrimus]